MRLYIKIDYKDKNEISGTIYNRVRLKDIKNEIYLRYKAERTSENMFDLQIYGCPKNKVYEVRLDETFDCSMTAKDILFYVEQRIDFLKNL